MGSSASNTWREQADRVADPGGPRSEGNVYRVELLTTGSPEAVPLPRDIFDGVRDRRVDLERVPQ